MVAAACTTDPRSKYTDSGLSPEAALVTAAGRGDMDAVKAFLDGKIGLADIVTVNKEVMENHSVENAGSLDVVLTADEWARSRAIMKIERPATAV